MTNRWIRYTFYFLFIILLQGLMMNQIQISELLYPMIYIMAILMLPLETSLFVSIMVSLILGVLVDSISDTFGLHTSSSLLVAYTRPYFLKFIRPRDGYDNTLLPSIHDMGKSWFLTYILIMLMVHHLWFFTFEIFKFNMIGTILLKTIFSTLLSTGFIVILQYIFYKPSKH